MNDINTAVEKLAMQKEASLSHQNRIKVSDATNPSGRGDLFREGMFDHNEFSDEELVRNFVDRRDEESFGELVSRYGDKVYRIALRITRNPHDAEDVLQEVFVILMEKLNTFHEEAKFSTWLHTVAANASFIHLRAQKKYKDHMSLEDYASYDDHGVLSGVEAKDWSGRTADELLSREGMKIIEKAVAELPVSCRVVFHLRDVEGFSNEEVARVLGLSLAAVKSRIHRARLFLRDRLSDYFHEWKQ